MCLALIAFQTLPEWPVFIAANRDEFHDRPGEPPRVEVQGAGRVLAPRDPRHGGTWIGVREGGLFAVITNRRDCPPQPGGSSRGLLVRQVLAGPDLAGARQSLAAAHARPSDPYNLLLGDGRRLLLGERCGTTPPRIRELGRGVHVATNHGPVSDPGIAEVRRALDVWGAGLAAGGDPLAVARELLALDTADGDQPALCKDHGDHGTVSATIIGIDEVGGIHMWHAEGPPNRHEFRAVPFTETGTP